VPTLVSRLKMFHMSVMADAPITLEFLARRQQRVLDEIGVMRDDMQVLTALRGGLTATNENKFSLAAP
jgi:hypothetical protein